MNKKFPKYIKKPKSDRFINIKLRSPLNPPLPFSNNKV